MSDSISQVFWMLWAGATCVALLTRVKLGIGMLLITMSVPSAVLPTRMLNVTGLNAFNPPFLILLLKVLIDGLPPSRHPRKLAVAFIIVLVLYFVTIVRSMIDFDTLVIAGVHAVAYAGSTLAYARDFLIKPAQYLFVLIVAARYLTTEEEQRNALFPIVVAFTVGVVYCLGENNLLGELLTGHIPNIKHIHGQAGVFGAHPNTAIIQISCVMFVALALVSWGPPDWRRWVLVACLPVLGVSVLVCGSRAAMLSLATGAVVVAFYVPATFRTRATIAGVCAGAVVAGIVFVPSIRAKATDVVTQGPWQALYSEREDIWDFLRVDVEKSFVIGRGRHAVARSENYHKIKRRESNIDHPHNAYLEILLDSGLVGLALVMRLLWLLVQQLRWRLRMAHPRALPIAPFAGLCALAAFCVAGLTGQTMYPRGYNVFLWLLLMWGTVVPVAQVARQTRAARQQQALRRAGRGQAGTPEDRAFHPLPQTRRSR